MPTPLQNMSDTHESIKQLIDDITTSGDASIQTIVNRWRQNSVLITAEAGQLDPLTTQVLKQRLYFLSQQVQRQLTQTLSDNQRRLFIKGIQTIDNVLKSGGISTALPYLSEQTLNALQNYSAVQIKGLTDNAYRNISNELDLAVLGQKPSGDVIEAIGKNLTDPSIFGTIAKRASVIYQTEVKRIQNIATADRIRQTQQQVRDLGKKWIHSHVGIPRPYHLFLHGTIVKADEQFELQGEDGEVYMIDGPHDPILPVSEVVNCFVGETQIDETNPEAIFKSKYSGQLITLQTSRGNKITVTPNHPILTSNGFVKAMNFRIGDDVICCPLGKLSAVGNPNIDYIPSTFEKKFNSFRIKFMNQRITLGGVNFYGDIPKGNVEIVFTNSFLKKRFNSFLLKPRSKTSFILSNIELTSFFPQSLIMQFFGRAYSSTRNSMGRFILFLSLLRSHLFPTQVFSFASIPVFASMSFQKSHQTWSRNVVNQRKLFDRLTSKVFGENILRNWNFLSSCFDAMLFKVPKKSGFADMEFPTNFLGKFTGNVFPDKISSINFFHADSIDVFTMQTTNGIYNANGILASNCRCTVVPVVMRFLEK
jgi:hypothetical protein